jgi:NAD(P)-dependent dehydrogenase (short-subunit alcohol dehydrogenase family)
MTETVPRAALVTGAAQPVGATLARALAAAGWRIAAQDAEADAVAALAAEITGAALIADLAEDSAVAALVPRAAASVGPLGLVVNAASLCRGDTLASVDRAAWDAHLATNLRAPFVLSRALAAQLPEGASGIVVNLLGEDTKKLRADRIAYQVSKAALWGLTRTLALALAPRVRVVAIGGIDRDSRRASELTAALHFLLAAPAMTGQAIDLS